MDGQQANRQKSTSNIRLLLGPNQRQQKQQKRDHQLGSKNGGGGGRGEGSGWACQLELRRSLLLLLLMGGAVIEHAPSCFAAVEENNGNNNNNEAAAYYEQTAGGGGAEEEEASGGDKRAGGRAFMMPAASFAESEKRGGGRAFAGPVAEEKRGGARAAAFHGSQGNQPNWPLAFNLEKRDGTNKAAFYFYPDEKKKRGGARPFFGSGFFGGDGTWKRGGGRFFFRQFADSGFGNGWAKRAGGRHFSMKRAGGRSFFGGMDSLFNPADYWAPQRYAPVAKLPRRTMTSSSPMGSALDEDIDDIAVGQQQAPSIPSPFYYTNNHNFDGQTGGKRGGARAFGDPSADAMMGLDLLEKKGGGRMFNGGGAR